MTPYICRTCQTVLDRYTNDDGVGYRHGASHPDDHPVDPTPMPDGFRGQCDFCDGPASAVLPADDFELGHGNYSDGDWACCDVCAALLERNQWNNLIDRARDAWETRHGPIMPPTVEMELRAVYRKLRKHVTGPVRSL